MSHTARLRLRVQDPERLLAALAPDGGDAHIEDGMLVLTADSRTVLGLLRTLDDQLACLRAAGVP